MSKTVNKIKELIKALQEVEELAKELDDTAWQSEVLRDEAQTFFKVHSNALDMQGKLEQFVKPTLVRELVKFMDKFEE